MGVPFFYTGMQTAIVGLFCLACWKLNWTKADPSMNFFEMLLGNHQDSDEKAKNDGHNEIETPENDEEKNNSEDNKQVLIDSTRADEGNH